MARGDLRAKGAVELEDCEGGTQVRVLADVVLGGMLGSLGHRVIVRRAAEVTEGFAAALAKALEAWNASGAEPGPGPRIQPQCSVDVTESDREIKERR